MTIRSAENPRSKKTLRNTSKRSCSNVCFRLCFHWCAPGAPPKLPLLGWGSSVPFTRAAYQVSQVSDVQVFEQCVGRREALSFATIGGLQGLSCGWIGDLDVK